MIEAGQRLTFEEYRALQMKFRRLGYPRKFDVLRLLNAVERQLREGTCENCSTILALSESVKAPRRSDGRLVYPSKHQIRWALEYLGAVKSKTYGSWIMPDMELNDD